ncbi:reverse transcriptase domain-containing protein [Tanacetum coccineum]
MDQMLERLARNEYYCFLDGFSGYFQIPIDPLDQEKTTFTCPYGTFAYRRMPFGLCNAPGTFQRCMVANISDFMIEKTMEVFMDDFSVFGDSFSSCLSHLDKMLQRCEDTNLVLNWEKCHFMVKEGIVLGHKISKSGIEVDKAKGSVRPSTTQADTYASKTIMVAQAHSQLQRIGITCRSIMLTRNSAISCLVQKHCVYSRDHSALKVTCLLSRMLSQIAPEDFAALKNLYLCYPDLKSEQKSSRQTHLSRLENFPSKAIGSSRHPRACHNGPSGGDIKVQRFHAKSSLMSVSSGPTFYKDAHELVIKNCDCALLSKKNFHNVMRCLKISSKFVKSFLRFGVLTSWRPSRLKKGTNIISWPSITCRNRFGAPRAIISDRGTHFCNDQFAKVMLKYGVTHRLSTAYHPQTSGQVEVSNRGLKRILERTIGENRASWSDKLDDAIGAFVQLTKTPIMVHPYKLDMERSCLSSTVELEHKAYWALKHTNFDIKTAGDHRKVQLNELNELRDHAYENSLNLISRNQENHGLQDQGNRVFNVG